MEDEAADVRLALLPLVDLVAVLVPPALELVLVPPPARVALGAAAGSAAGGLPAPLTLGALGLVVGSADGGGVAEGAVLAAVEVAAAATTVRSLPRFFTTDPSGISTDHHPGRQQERDECRYQQQGNEANEVNRRGWKRSRGQRYRFAFP